MRFGKPGSFLAVAALLTAPFAFASGPRVEKLGSLEQKVRHELNMLPYYGVFDFLAFKYDRGTAVLMGYAYAPNLKHDAEHAVKRVAGVDTVDTTVSSATTALPVPVPTVPSLPVQPPPLPSPP